MGLGKDLLSISLLICILVLMFSMFTVQHEFTHKTVALDYGCEADMNIPDFENGNGTITFATTNISGCPDANYEANMKSQQTVEAVGYQIMPLYLFIGFIFYVTILQGKHRKDS